MAMHFPIMSTSSCAQEWNDRAAAAFQLEGTQPAQANRPSIGRKSTIAVISRSPSQSERLTSAFLLRRTSDPAARERQERVQG